MGVPTPVTASHHKCAQVLRGGGKVLSAKRQCHRDGLVTIKHILAAGGPPRRFSRFIPSGVPQMLTRQRVTGTTILGSLTCRRRHSIRTCTPPVENKRVVEGAHSQVFTRSCSAMGAKKMSTVKTWKGIQPILSNFFGSLKILESCNWQNNSG